MFLIFNKIIEPYKGLSSQKLKLKVFSNEKFKSEIDLFRSRVNMYYKLKFKNYDEFYHDLVNTCEYTHVYDENKFAYEEGNNINFQIVKFKLNKDNVDLVLRRPPHLPNSIEPFSKTVSKDCFLSSVFRWNSLLDPEMINSMPGVTFSYYIENHWDMNVPMIELSTDKNSLKLSLLNFLDYMIFKHYRDALLKFNLARLDLMRDLYTSQIGYYLGIATVAGTISILPMVMHFFDSDVNSILAIGSKIPVPEKLSEINNFINLYHIEEKAKSYHVLVGQPSIEQPPVESIPTKVPGTQPYGGGNNLSFKIFLCIGGLSLVCGGLLYISKYYN